MDKRVGFIGAGQMAEALARGFINKGVVRADQVGAGWAGVGSRPAGGGRLLVVALAWKPAGRAEAVCQSRTSRQQSLPVIPASSRACPHASRRSQVFATDVVPERKDVFRSFGTTALDGNVEVRCC